MDRLDFNTLPHCEVPRGRYFTVSEANRALVLVRRIIADVVTHYGRMLDLQEMIDAATDCDAPDLCRKYRMQIVQVAQRLRDCAQELDDVGVVLQDWAQGVVDFPSMQHGRLVWLCWRHGDQQVAYWHDTDGDYTGRHSIAELEELAPVKS